MALCSPGPRLAERGSREKPRVHCAYPGYDWLEEVLAKRPRCTAVTRATHWPEEVLAKSSGCAALTRATLPHGLHRLAGAKPTSRLLHISTPGQAIP